jgi:flagellar hook-associated protein 1 FlgK
MGLSSLSTALSGLSIAQRQIDIISNNVSNVGTDGYTRKILPQYSQAIDGRGVGVLAGIVGRNVDLNLSQSLWTQISAVEYNKVQASYLNRISQFHGPPDQELSVASEISNLHDSFAILSDDPTDPFLLAQTIDKAVDMASKVNNLSSLITNLRNDAQSQMTDTVNQINNYLQEIANMNQQIRRDMNIGKSTAEAEDIRDRAVKNLSGLMDISLFKRGDGVMVIQTARGAELASETAQSLFFDPGPLSPTIYYPDSAAGIYIGNPNNGNNNAYEITNTGIGGSLGGLLELRDVTFPKQSAQIDELAHKLALRFEAQGLRLFTDETGGLPADTPPDLTTDPPTPVAYVGFADKFRVNAAILADNRILQTGTSGALTEQGSNEVIRRIIDFTFGDVNYQQAIGAVDLRVSANASPNDRLQTFLGILSSNEVTGARSLSSFADPASFITATNGTINAGNGTFRITLEEPDLGLGPVNLDIDLTAVADGAGNFNQDIIDHINTVLIPALPAGDQADLLDMDVQFTSGVNGELSITSSGNITLDGTAPANAMGNTNLSLLGFTANTYEASDPYFDIAVGNNDLTRIYIEPADTEVELLAKLDAVTGLAARLNANGELELRPGNDFTTPDFGGDLRIVSGPFKTESAGANAVFGAGTIVDGVNMISGLLGSFTAGPPPLDFGPLESVRYQSQVSTTDTTMVAFREDYLGPDAAVSARVLGSTTLADFAQKLVNEQTQEIIILEDRIEDDDTFRDLLEDQMLRDSGVNLDEELSHLIVVQTAYAASARVVNVVDELFQELLSVLR